RGEDRGDGERRADDQDPSHGSLLLPGVGALRLDERPEELDAERAGAAVVRARELERPLRLRECARPLEHRGVAGDAEDVAALVAATGRTGNDLEVEHALAAGHRARAEERHARRLARVRAAGADDLAGAD